MREWLKNLPKDERKIMGEDIMTVQFRWPLGMPLVETWAPAFGKSGASCRPGSRASSFSCTTRNWFSFMASSRKRGKLHRKTGRWL